MISVIIPARNAAATIGISLSSLAADRTLIGEILLIDDGSHDDTVARAEEAARGHSLPLKVTRVSFGNAGAARNAGLARTSGEHVFFLDADDEVIPGGLTLLHDALLANPHAGLAVGASVHRGSQAGKLKLPGRYGGDRHENARKYLANGLRSITVGSGLVTAAATANIRFPERIGLDEDTVYWAAVMTRALVTTVDRPVLFYNLDETRMAKRFITEPRKAFLHSALQINGLAAFGIDRTTLQERKAFIAQRIARHLLRRKRYREADRIMRAVRAHPRLRSSLTSLRYRVRLGLGHAAQFLGRSKPALHRDEPTARTPPRRVLVLTADPAFPPVSGADLRNYQNARAVARIADVLLVSVRSLATDLQPEGRIRAAALRQRDEPRGLSTKRLRTSIEIRIPRTARRRLTELVRSFDPDTIIVEGMPLFALIEHLRPLAGRLILDMHNVESTLASKLRPARLLAGVLPLRWSNEGRIRAAERKALKIVDRVWVCSDADRERLRLQFDPGIPVDVVPNGVPRAEAAPATLPPLPGKDDGWPVLLFVGHLGYEPNVVAAERLARNILPLVRRSFPSARLILAGRIPKRAVHALAALPGVELAADPADIVPLLARSHISVVPLSAGGGTRIKILEAMAWGLPVVATPIAAEGLEFSDGVEIAVADTDEAFARAVVALCSDPARLERQRSLACARAIQLYGPRAIEEAVEKALGLTTADVKSPPDPAVSEASA